MKHPVYLIRMVDKKPEKEFNRDKYWTLNVTKAVG